MRDNPRASSGRKALPRASQGMHLRHCMSPGGPNTDTHTHTHTHTHTSIRSAAIRRTNAHGTLHRHDGTQEGTPDGT